MARSRSPEDNSSSDNASQPHHFYRPQQQRFRVSGQEHQNFNHARIGGRSKKDVELFLALNTQIVMVQPNGQQIGMPINVQQQPMYDFNYNGQQYTNQTF